MALYPEDGGLRDTRGLARALSGDIEGAIEDFEAFIWSRQDRGQRKKRAEWIEGLRLVQAGEKTIGDVFPPDKLKEIK